MSKDKLTQIRREINDRIPLFKAGFIALARISLADTLFQSKLPTRNVTDSYIEHITSPDGTILAETDGRRINFQHGNQQIFSLVHSDDRATFETELRQSEQNPHKFIRTMARIKHIDPLHPDNISWRYNIIQIHHFAGLVIFVAHDVNSLMEPVIRQRDEAEMQSVRDPLTNLYTRRFYDRIINQEEGNDRTPLAAVFIDVNNMKIVNDYQGHEAGDELLKETAGFLTRFFRKQDVIFRYGGDEFVVLMRLTNFPGHPDFVKRIKKRFNRRLRQYNESHPTKSLSLAIGIQVVTNGKVKDAFKKADALMYEDKKMKKRKKR